MNGDLAEKLGQIAHLDGDRSNNSEDNLAWLCLNHHSIYDSTTKQHKNYSPREVKSSRSKLYELVDKGQHLTPIAAQPYLQNEVDKKILRDLIEMVPSTGSISFLKNNDFAGSYIADSLAEVFNFGASCIGPEHEFLDIELEKKRKHLLESCQTLRAVLAHYTFVIPIEGHIQVFPRIGGLKSQHSSKPQ